MPLNLNTGEMTLISMSTKPPLSTTTEPSTLLLLKNLTWTLLKRLLVWTKNILDPKWPLLLTLSHLFNLRWKHVCHLKTLLWEKIFTKLKTLWWDLLMIPLTIKLWSPLTPKSPKLLSDLKKPSEKNTWLMLWSKSNKLCPSYTIKIILPPLKDNSTICRLLWMKESLLTKTIKLLPLILYYMNPSLLLKLITSKKLINLWKELLTEPNKSAKSWEFKLLSPEENSNLELNLCKPTTI